MSYQWRAMKSPAESSTTKRRDQGCASYLSCLADDMESSRKPISVQQWNSRGSEGVLAQATPLRTQNGALFNVSGTRAPLCQPSWRTLKNAVSEANRTLCLWHFGRPMSSFCSNVLSAVTIKECSLAHIAHRWTHECCLLHKQQGIVLLEWNTFLHIKLLS